MPRAANIASRMLTAKAAAQYCGIPHCRFPAAVGVAPVALPGGILRYDRKDLDRWLDTLKPDALNSRDEILARLPG